MNEDWEECPDCGSYDLQLVQVETYLDIDTQKRTEEAWLRCRDCQGEWVVYTEIEDEESVDK